MKTVVICLHGLIKDAPHDFIPFKQYVEENNIDIEVNCLMLYDIANKKTYKYKNKLKLLDETISNYEKEGYRIILVGYSFSTGLVARMCKNHSIYKAILISPVMHIITRSGINYYLSLFFKSFKMRAKAMMNKKKRNRLKKMNSLYLFDLLCSCFYALHKTNRSFKYIKCPTLVMFGKKDEITYPKYLSQIRNQIGSKVDFKINFYPEANHVFIMSKKVDKSIYYKDMIEFAMEVEKI